MRKERGVWSSSALALGLVGLSLAGPARAEQPLEVQPIPKLEQVSPATGEVFEKLSLSEAVRRALVRHPTAVVAQQEIKRAEALLVQARAGSLPGLSVNASLLRLDADRMSTFGVIARQNQQSANLLLSVPIIAPQRWVQWSQAAANLDTAKASGEDVRRTLAVTTARAYLAILSQKRQVDISMRAVATDRSHYDHTHTRFAGGVGTRVDEVRAAQQLATDQVHLSAGYAALARAREALGVLLGGDKPVDTLDEVSLPDASPSFEDAAARRRDVLSAKQRATVAQKVSKDSWADYTPTVNAQFQPFFQHPASFTMPETGWQAMVVLNFPLFEGGLRAGQKRERDVVVAEARAQYDHLLRQTRSDLRVAVEAIRRATEAMQSSHAAADLAHQALELATLAYKAGATTNLEVIDAERRARDADSAAVIAEDNLRQARLDLLVAAGQFP